MRLPVERVTLTEEEVAAIVIASLSPSWVEWWTEVPVYSGRVDIVGKDVDGNLHAVEVKTRPSLALAGQAAKRVALGGFSTVLVAVGIVNTVRDGGVSDLSEIGLHAGFGVGYCRHHPAGFGKDEHRDFVVAHQPPMLTPTVEGIAEVSPALNDIHRKVSAGAGATSSRYWTPWKQAMAEVESALLKMPNGATVRDLEHRIIQSTSHALTWSSRRAQIRKILDLMPVQVVTVGREHRYTLLQPQPPRPEARHDD